MAKFSPLPLGGQWDRVSTAGTGVHDWMQVPTPGLEGLLGAGGPRAGRRAPTDLVGPHITDVGLHTEHQAVDGTSPACSGA